MRSCFWIIRFSPWGYNGGNLFFPHPWNSILIASLQHSRAALHSKRVGVSILLSDKVSRVSEGRVTFRNDCFSLDKHMHQSCVCGEWGREQDEGTEHCCLCLFIMTALHSQRLLSISTRASYPRCSPWEHKTEIVAPVMHISCHKCANLNADSTKLILCNLTTTIFKGLLSPFRRCRTEPEGGQYAVGHPVETLKLNLDFPSPAAAF